MRRDADFFKNIPLSFITLSVMITLMLSASHAQAQAQSTSVIPYQGTLFSQGKPVSQSAPVRMAFAIYSDNAGLEAGQFATAPEIPARKWTSWDATGEAGDTIDSDKTIDVSVRNGRFLVHLGDTEIEQSPLNDDIFDEDTLYVVAWVMNDTTVYRLPPQELKTVPHAVTARRATSFSVTGTLHTDRISSLTGEAVNVTSPLKVDHLSARTQEGPVNVSSRVLIDLSSTPQAEQTSGLSIRNRSRDSLPDDGDTHLSRWEDGRENNYIRGAYTKIMSSVTNIFSATVSHVFSGGVTLFGDTLSTRRASVSYNYPGGETSTFTVSCLENETLLSGGCSRNRPGLSLRSSWPAPDMRTWLCSFTNTTTGVVSAAALAVCLKVSE